MDSNMKKSIIFSLAALAVLACGVSCSEEPLDSESVIVADQYTKNDFDKWLEANYVSPYNIEFKYRYENIESDLSYYTVPADYDCSVALAHLVKHLCIDTYDEVGGVDFTREYFPKEFFLIGEWQYKNNGTYILGTAESGKKILLAGVNYLFTYLKSASSLNSRYIKTIHHEFTHILNQTRDFPAAFREITGSSYVSDSWSASPYNVGYLTRGFISAYAQNSATEDFAEMMSIYVVNTPEWWDAQLEEAGEDGAALIKSKLDYVRSYMADTFNIDIDLLRSVVIRRQNEVLAGKVDLTDLSLD
jgi:substrate import-associated zinc metallohydrolase lipoprotein